MKQTTIKTFRQASLVLLVAVTWLSCKKNDIATPPDRASFISVANTSYISSGAYFITAPGVTYEVTVGVTTKADQDRVINFSVTSPTGAQQGSDYTLGSNSVTIPAGEVLGKIVINGNFNNYLNGEKDTLVFKLENTAHSGGIEPTDWSSTFRLLMRGPCFETDIVPADLVGVYANTFEGTYGPYTTEVLSITPLTATTAEATIANIYNSGWNDMTVLMDWTDPANPTVTFDPQATGQDAGELNPAVAGHEVYMYPVAAGGPPSFYSYCTKTFSLTFRLCMPTFGACFTGTTTVDMAQ